MNLLKYFTLFTFFCATTSSFAFRPQQNDTPTDNAATYGQIPLDPFPNPLPMGFNEAALGIQAPPQPADLAAERRTNETQLAAVEADITALKQRLSELPNDNQFGQQAIQLVVQTNAISSKSLELQAIITDWQNNFITIYKTNLAGFIGKLVLQLRAETEPNNELITATSLIQNQMQERIGLLTLAVPLTVKKFALKLRLSRLDMLQNRDIAGVEEIVKDNLMVWQMMKTDASLSPTIAAARKRVICDLTDYVTAKSGEFELTRNPNILRELAEKNEIIGQPPITQ